MDKKRPVRIRIRALDRPADFDGILEIQRRVWGHDEADLTPTHLFRITIRLGAILLGGFVDGRLAGFVYSFPAVFHGRLIQHSHLLAVLPEFQGLGLGKALKWAQRDRALALGHDLVTWTFDPLQARNANLNLHALGAVSRTYWRNFYGAQEALVLGPGVETDRFLVEWPIRSRRVANRREAGCARPVPNTAVCAFAAGPGGPGRPELSLASRVILAEVPCSVTGLQDRPELIAAWQKGLRRTLLHYLGQGYLVDDFLSGDRCFYVLRRGAASR